MVKLKVLIPAGASMDEGAWLPEVTVRLAASVRRVVTKNNVGKEVVAGRGAKAIATADGVLGGGAVPVDEVLGIDGGGGRATLVSGNVRLGDGLPSRVVEAVSPLGATVVLVVGLGTGDIVAFTEICRGGKVRMTKTRRKCFIEEYTYHSR